MSPDQAVMERPQFTMPEAEAARLTEAYSGAKSVLEYGSGGSTIMGAEAPGPRAITSVESDKAWAKMMRDWFTAHPVRDEIELDIIWADIGPTKAWGFPVNGDKAHLFPGYALGVWTDSDLVQPEVVLVDGRFRVGCALATALYTKSPVTLFIDDYDDRPNYHGVERWFGAPRMTGRLAEWDVAPLALDMGELPRIMKLMMRPG